MAPRTGLNWNAKLQILKGCLRRKIQGSVHELAEVILWGKYRLKLDSTPSRMTIIRIIQHAHCVEAKAESVFCNHNKATTVTSNIIQEQLRDWVWEMWQNRICITVGLIKEKGRRIQLDTEKEDDLKFSYGGLQSFKR